MSKKEMTDLDKRLQQMALSNWEQFVQLVGKDTIIAAKVCLLRQAGDSFGKIGFKLNVPPYVARYACKKCDD
jgi:hypothetical protein